MSTATGCDGGCLEHSGLPVAVRVTGGLGGWSPFSFNYCEAAIQSDRDNGFTVEVV